MKIVTNKTKMNVFCVVLILSSVLWSLVTSQSCTTPLAVKGECISLFECTPLMTTLETRPVPTKVSDFLKKSHCGFLESEPKVCCPLMPVNINDITNLRFSNAGEYQDLDPVATEDSSPEPEDSCGIDNSDDRLFGGTIAGLDEFPWMAMLGYIKKDGSLSYQCAGALINHRYVLTAAHCIIGSVIREFGKLSTVRLGEHDVRVSIDCKDDLCAGPIQEITVDRGYPHLGYDEFDRGKPHDIGIVRLLKRAKYTDFIQPICLHGLIKTAPTNLRTGISVYVSGWGKTLSGQKSQVKEKLKLPIFDKKSCVEKYGGYRVNITEKQICAGGALNKDSCKGDSGAPLMLLTIKEEKQIWEAIGLVSFGNDCGKEGWPGIYTSVLNYLDWIKSTLRSTNV